MHPMYPGRCVLDTIIQRGASRQLQGKQRDDDRKVLIRASKAWYSNSTHKTAVKLPTACVGLKFAPHYLKYFLIV